MKPLTTRAHPSSTFMPLAPNRLLAGLLVVMLSAAACGTTSGVRQTIDGYDLAERFNLVHNEPPRAEGGVSFARHYEVTRNGVPRDAMLLVAPAEIRASLAGIKGQVILEGLAPPVFNIGDGIHMEIFLSDSHGCRKVFERSFDPGRRAQDRAWIPLEIPVELDGAASSQMGIRVSAGIQGDLVADWLALSSMRVVWKRSGR